MYYPPLYPVLTSIIRCTNLHSQVLRPTHCPPSPLYPDPASQTGRLVHEHTTRVQNITDFVNTVVLLECTIVGNNVPILFCTLCMGVTRLC